jgi:hypothetical protein
MQPKPVKVLLVLQLECSIAELVASAISREVSTGTLSFSGCQTSSLSYKTTLV